MALCSTDSLTRWAIALCVTGCGARTTLHDTLERDVPSDPPAGSTGHQPDPDPDPDPEPELPCQQGMCPDDGDLCNGVEFCDPDTNRCARTDPLSCDDGLACNGVESCDPAFGCVRGEAIACEAPGAYCDENTGGCSCDKPFLGPDCTIKTALFAYFGQVRDLAEERGVLWVTTTNGLWALDFAGTPGEPGDDNWSYFDAFEADSNTGSLLIDPNGDKWLAGGYQGPLARLDDGGTPLDQDDDIWYFYRYRTRFLPQALGFDGGGTIWLGRSGEALTFWDGLTPGDRSDDSWRPIGELGAPASLVDLSNVDSIVSEPLGTVWLGSSTGGLFAYDARADQFAELIPESWLRVAALAWEEETLWIAVAENGDVASQLAALRVTDSVLDVSDEDWEFIGVPHAITKLDADAGGHVWASHSTPGLSCLDLSSGAWSETPFDAQVGKILARSGSDLWLGGDSVVYLDHEGSCTPPVEAFHELLPDQALRSPARDVESEGDGLWFATDTGVDYLDTGGTPFDRDDDRWAHFDEHDVAGLQGLQGVVLGRNRIKYFWGDARVFAFDDGGSPLDKGDDSWVGHDTLDPLWVSGVVDSAGVLMVVARTFVEPGGTPRVVVFDPGSTPTEPSDDGVTTIDSGLPGMGRTMAIDTEGEVWVGTEAENYEGNLYHWDRSGTPLDESDDVWTPVRPEAGRVWKLVRDPTGGVWGAVTGGVFQFYDGGTPTDLSDDYWHLYTELGSAMEIGADGDGWFRMPGGAGILDVGGTPREPGDDIARTLLSPEALRFASDLWTNGTIDDEGRFWVVDENAQVFEVVE